MEKLLIEKAKSGNGKAFKKLYDLNVTKLFRFLSQFTDDSDLVEDWVQQAFIKAFENIEGFRGSSKFSSWLFSIGINEMRNDLKRRNKFNFGEEGGSDDLLHIYHQKDSFEWHHDMKILLREIDERKRAVFLLFEIEGYSHSEISEMLSISEAQCRTTLHRSKKILKEKYNQIKGAV